MTGWQFIPAVLSAAIFGGSAAFAVWLIIALSSCFFGRIYCSWFCPLGLFQEVVERTGHAVCKTPKRVFKPAHRLFRVIFFAVITALVLGGTALPLGYVEPYSVFGKFASTLCRSLFFWINSETVNLNQSAVFYDQRWIAALVFYGVLLFIFIALIVFKGRIFCNTLCPAGTLLALLAHYSRRGCKLVIDKDKCVKCGKCVNVCNANCIDITDSQTIDFARCFMCLECAGVCPVKAVKYVSKKSARAIAGEQPLTGTERRRFITGVLAGGVTAFWVSKFAVKSAPAPQGIVPPGGVSQDEFLARCTGCGLCIANCRGGCLQPAVSEYGLRGFMLPVMKFSGSNPGKCEYECNNCTANCPTGALKHLNLKEKQLCRIGMAKFHPQNCVAYADGQPCGACGEHCPTGALKMVPGTHKFATVPQVMGKLCIGCGNCQYACPVTPQAIRIVPVKKQSKAADPSEVRKSEEVKKVPSSIPF
ncbi:MAG: 4Fe-4S binding protein [Lentisphaeria bacterium]|nr:4Fe-4S binding protein [Lentisphaeria bacterium]